MITRLGNVAIGVPGGDFCGEANDGATEVAGEQFDRKLIEAALVTVEGFVEWRDETIEKGKFLAGISLQIFQSLFHLGPRHGEISCVGDGLGGGFAPEECEAGEAEENFGKSRWGNPQGSCSRSSWGSHPRWPSGVSTPNQCGVTIRITTSVKAERVLSVAADWNGAAFKSAPGDLTRRSSS